MTKNRLLLAILLSALILRLIFIFAAANNLPHNDSYQHERSYETIAKNLIAGQGYQGSGFIIGLTAEQKAARPPVYPIFLALCYLIFGQSLLYVQIIQALLSVLSVLLIYLIGRKVFDEQTGLVAGAISAFYPFLIFLTGTVVTETVFILFFLVFIYLLVQLWPANGIAGLQTSRPEPGPNPVNQAQGSRNTWKWAILVGIANGLAILTRSSFILFFVLLAPFGLIKKQSRLSYCLLVAATLTMLCPWVIRNYAVFNRVIFTSTQYGLALYEANSPRATGRPDIDNLRFPPEIINLPEAEREDAIKKMALQWIKENPGKFARLALLKFCYFWNPLPNCADYRSLKYILISIFSYGTVLILAFWQIIRMRKSWGRIGIFLLVILYFSLIHLVYVSSVRYRAPVDALLIILAANNIARFIPKRNK